MSFPVLFDDAIAIPLSKDPAKVVVKWSLQPTKIKLSDFEFYIDRGETPEQDPDSQNLDIDGKPLPKPAPHAQTMNFRQISVDPISALDFYEYVDYGPALLNLILDVWYRVRCRRISTQEEIASQPFTFKGGLDLIGIYIVDEHNFMFKDATGQPLLVRQRRRGGEKCHECFDPVQGARSKSNCLTCFGTNWTGGFYGDTSVWGNLNAIARDTAIQEWGETQPGQSDILFTNYPFLRPGDLIRSIVEHRLFRVVKVRIVEKRTAPMLQTVRLAELNPKDIEYSLPYNERLAQELRKEYDAILRRREF